MQVEQVQQEQELLLAGAVAEQVTPQMVFLLVLLLVLLLAFSITEDKAAQVEAVEAVLPH